MGEVLFAAVAADEVRGVHVGRELRDDDEHLVAVVKGCLSELEEVRELVGRPAGQGLEPRVLLAEFLLQERVERGAVGRISDPGGRHELFDEVRGAEDIDRVFLRDLPGASGGGGADLETFHTLTHQIEPFFRRAVFNGSFQALQFLHDDAKSLFAVINLVEPVAHVFEQQADDCEPFIEACHAGPLHDLFRDVAGKDLVDLVVGLVFVVEVVVDRELFRDAVVLQVLLDQFRRHREVVLFIEVDDVGQVFPAAGRHEGFTVHRRLHEVEVGIPDRQIGRDGRVDLGLIGVLFPRRIVRFDVDSLQTVPGDDVEFADRVVVLRRVAGGDDDPSVRDGVHAEGLELQELQHGRRQGLRDAVDLIEEQDALLLPRLFHRLIHGGDDFGHRVLRHAHVLSAVDLVGDVRQAQGALAGVVGHRIGDQRQVQFGGDLRHDGSFTDAGRAHQEDGTLPLDRDDIVPDLVAGQVGLYRKFDLFFCFSDIHTKSSSSKTNLMAQGGTSGSPFSSRMKMNAAS